jgi:hypothetical protein
MKRTLFVLPFLAAGLLVTGCSKKTDDAAKVAEAATAAAQNAAAIGQSAATNPGARKPGVAVPAKTLAGFLGAPSGYTMQGNPETMEMAVEDQKYSTAQAKYNSGDKNITVSIFDYNNITGLSMAYTAMMNMSVETNEESLHSDKIAGFPAWVDWKKNSNSGTIGVVVNDRIFVVIEASGGATLDDLKAAANAVNLSGIASASKS